MLYNIKYITFAVNVIKMSVYAYRSFIENPHPRPSHDIPVDEKNSVWIRKNIEYTYGQYLTGQTGITIEDADHIKVLRKYAEGRQPTEQYRKRWLNEIKDKKVNSYNHIDFENFYSPMPKYIDKLLGLFIAQDHNTIATCTAEFSKEHKTTEKAKKSAMIKLRGLREKLNIIAGTDPNQDPMLNPQNGFALRDLEELEILMASGSEKLPYELAAEKIIDITKKVSNYKHLKREAVRDLACGYIAFREDEDGEKIIWKNVDITDVIIEYSKDTHFSNARYAGIQEWWSIGELRTKGFKEEDLKKYASKYHEFNMDRMNVGNENRAFQFYNVYYTESNSWGYDEYMLPVLYGEFKSDDVEYRKAVKTIAGDTRYYKSDFGK